MTEENSIQMTLLRDKIMQGVKQIHKQPNQSEAILFIGDTGVGKSTLLSYLIGNQLKIQEVGLKPCLVNVSEGKYNSLKIGHQKYSETSVPVKVSIEGLCFYDCPGFNDNKSREDQIANSFYYQRLLSIYEKTKLVIVVDQSFLTETRAHRLPSLAKKLQSAFGCLQKVKYSTLFVVNKCDPDSDMYDLEKEFKKLISTVGMFTEQQVKFFQFLINNGQLFSFKQPKRCNIGKLIGQQERISMLKQIGLLDFMDKIQIKHIISDIAKLAIRDYLDVLATQANESVIKLMEMLKQVIFQSKTGRYQIKEQVMRVFESKNRMQQRRDFSPFFDFCVQRKIQSQFLDLLKSQLQIVQFFSEVYSKHKTESFYFSIQSLIITNLSIILQKVDTMIEQEKLEVQRKKRKQQRKRQQQRLKALEQTNKQNMIARQKREQKVKQNKSPIKTRQVEIQRKSGSNGQEQPVTLAFHRKLMTAQLKIKEISYEISQFHNKASNFTNIINKM